MQLFITEFTKNWNTVLVDNKEIIEQMRKVLRLKIWDRFFIQAPLYGNNIEVIRYEIELLTRDKNAMTGTIVSEETKQIEEKETSFIVCMPNKRDKAELIAQKLSEIGINNLIFRPSERSIIKQENTNKMWRILKISKEACEQSRRWNRVNISFVKELDAIVKNGNLEIFDFREIELNTITDWEQKNIFGLVGPEGWLTDKDYEYLKALAKKNSLNLRLSNLWTGILRTETACIIWARNLKNH